MGGSSAGEVLFVSLRRGGRGFWGRVLLPCCDCDRQDGQGQVALLMLVCLFFILFLATLLDETIGRSQMRSIYHRHY